MKRLWGIRHIRWFFLHYGLNRHIDRCRSMGLGYFAQQSDIDYLDAVLRGEK